MAPPASKGFHGHPKSHAIHFYDYFRACSCFPTRYGCGSAQMHPFCGDICQLGETLHVWRWHGAILKLLVLIHACAVVIRCFQRRNNQVPREYPCRWPHDGTRSKPRGQFSGSMLVCGRRASTRTSKHVQGQDPRREESILFADNMMCNKIMTSWTMNSSA